MKKINDDELEKLLADALKKEPETSLPFGFAAMVAKKAQAKPFGFASVVMALLTSVVVIVLVGFAVFLYFPDMIRPVFSFLLSIRYIIISIVLTYLVIEYLDQRFIKKDYQL